MKLLKRKCLCLSILLQALLLSSPSTAEDSKVYARFGNKKLHVNQIDQVINSNPTFLRMRKESPGNITALRKSVANRLINRTLLLEHAAASGAVSEAEVQANVEKIIKGYGGKKTLESQLKQTGANYKRFLEDVQNDFRINSFIKRSVIPTIEISEEELRAAYARNPALFSKPETIRARQILMALGPQAEEPQIRNAHKKLIQLREKILSGEKTFSDLARQYSEGPAASKGGDLGSFPRGRMAPEFDRVAFSLKPGLVSEPVRTQYGLHLIKVEAHHVPAPPSFKEAKPAVRRMLIKKSADQKVIELVEKLRQKAKVELLTPKS